MEDLISAFYSNLEDDSNSVINTNNENLNLNNK